MLPANSASTAAGPALNTWVLSVVPAERLLEGAVADAVDGAGVGDVGEVAEPQLGRPAPRSWRGVDGGDGLGWTCRW